MPTPTGFVDLTSDGSFTQPTAPAVTVTDAYYGAVTSAFIRTTGSGRGITLAAAGPPVTGQLWPRGGITSKG